MTEKVNTTPAQTQRRVIGTRAKTRGRKAIEKKVQTLSTLKIIYVSVNDLEPNSWNPNRQSDHDFELLLRSIEEDGFTQPVIALEVPSSSGKRIIIDGEHRWRAAVALKMDEIPVVLVNMNEEQARISTIRHNRARGSHDLALEAAIIRDLQALGALEWAKDSLILDDVELNRMLTDISAADALAGREFSDAWVPSDFSEEQRALIRDGVMVDTEIVVRPSGEVVQHAVSPRAIDIQRERERLIAVAESDAERKRIEQDNKVYRISLILAGDEANVVRRVLGEHTAEGLIRLCREELSRMEGRNGSTA